MIEQQGLTLVGLRWPISDESTAGGRAPVRRRSGAALDAALDEVRDRFGYEAVTRAVLLGRVAGFHGADAS